MSTSKDNAKYFGVGEISVQMFIMDPKKAHNVMDVAHFKQSEGEFIYNA
ncbi:MAG: hypothetical protein LBG59_05775 [Candidatus Peribacteria bacterium]|jgi:hypothetical protein|nr:hypothetical protein [Candidatus Peribacteria bacterium]